MKALIVFSILLGFVNVSLATELQENDSSINFYDEIMVHSSMEPTWELKAFSHPKNQAYTSMVLVMFEIFYMSQAMDSSCLLQGFIIKNSKKESHTLFGTPTQCEQIKAGGSNSLTLSVPYDGTYKNKGTNKSNRPFDRKKYKNTFYLTTQSTELI